MLFSGLCYAAVYSCATKVSEYSMDQDTLISNCQTKC